MSGVEVRGDLDEDGDVALVLLGELGLFGVEGADEGAAGIFLLEVAETFGVRRGEVDGDVVGGGVGGAETDEVVVVGAVVWGVEVFADVDAEDGGGGAAGDVGETLGDADVIEAHAVDDGFAVGDAEEARGWVAGLWAWCERADFDEAEAEGGEAVDGGTGFVETCGETDAVREAEPPEGERGGFWGGREESRETAADGRIEGGESDVVGLFSFHGEGERAEQRP